MDDANTIASDFSPTAQSSAAEMPDSTDHSSRSFTLEAATEQTDRGNQPEPTAVGAPLRVIEALLFAADTPLGAARLAELVGAGSAAAVREAVQSLNAQYETWGVAFRIEEIANGYQMMTLPEFRPWLNKLNRQRGETRLSDATLETLAIIAYKQPIIRSDVEAIRGVACGDVVNRLREMGLVRIVGRAEVVGRPMLYGTTKRFLEVFNLSNLDDLPPMEALKLRPKVSEPRSGGAPEPQAVAGA